jgi:cation transport ATPase
LFQKLKLWNSRDINIFILDIFSAEVVQKLRFLNNSIPIFKRRIMETQGKHTRLLDENGVSRPAVDTPGTAVYLSCDGNYAGHLEISDEPKADAGDAVWRLKTAGIRRVLMFTGGNSRTAAAVAESLGLDGFYGELLPQDKAAQRP